jgi:hypothetical protein
VNATLSFSMSLNIEPKAFIPRAVNTVELSSANTMVPSGLSE